MSLSRKWILLLFCGFFLGCASNPKQQFDQVKVGMEKNDVLLLMDSPQRTQRWQGKDRWTYIFYEKDLRFEKEVHFQEGVANYVGDIYHPEISADEQDLRNATANKELEDFEKSRQAEARKALSEYELRTRGQDTIRYVPQFVPVQ
jgi:outer membrane protein assembly factor BamE